jgi:hypothetical protein
MAAVSILKGWQRDVGPGIFCHQIIQLAEQRFFLQLRIQITLAQRNEAIIDGNFVDGTERPKPHCKQ